MRFFNALGWLGLLAIPVIIVIYIIKSQYVPKTVSSTFIWKRSLRFVKRKIPLNLIMSLLLILQVLVALAATIAITQPRIVTKTDEVIVIVDASASMNTDDGSGEDSWTRFDTAKQKIMEAASGSSVNMSIIYAGEVAENLSGDVPLTTKEEVEFIINDLKCTQGNGDINGALKLAEAIINTDSNIRESNRDAKVLIYTDKQHPIAESSINTIEIINCAGTDEKNTGIVSATDKFLSTVSGYRFDTYLQNYGSETTFTISMYMNDGNGERFVTSKNVTMRDKESLNVFFTSDDNPVTKPGQLAVWIANSFSSYDYVRFVINTDDGLAEDNEYKLYSLEKETPSILFVSKNIKYDENGNIDRNQEPLMKTVIGAFGYIIKNADMHSSVPTDKLSGYDLYIFEGIMPEVLPTDGAVWLLNMPKAPQNVNLQFGVERVSDNGFRMVVSDSLASDKVSQLLKSKVDFNDPIKGTDSATGEPITINAVINKYTTLANDLPKGFVSIYSTNNSPVMIAGKIGTVKTIMTTFDFTNSTLPWFLTDFPLLINNMLEYSLAEPLDERTAFVGETLQFEVPIGAQKIEFYTQAEEENSERVLLATWDSSKQYESDLPNIVFEQLGTYQVVVNFSNDIENEKLKTYTVTTHIPEKETSIYATGDMLDVTINETAKSQNAVKDILPWVIGVLIVLLIVEWGVYYRNEH
ncbi:MAG: BatA and WFA domain-containing protein [Clostridia bacterium]|nr:BatA and WFA domain-containing protein [Clostridia bacterium]